MVKLNGADLRFILEQIEIAEAHAAGTPLRSLIPNIQVPFGLRTITGEFNNIVPGQDQFGAADNVFPRMLDPFFRTAEFGTSYLQTSGLVIDSQPRTISNLVVDQTANNPAAVVAAAETPGSEIVISPGLDGQFDTPDDKEVFFIPNIAPDLGLSAPFNSWFTFFGQFFDHGLDLVTKGGSGTVFIPLNPDDPLFVPGSPTNFMVLTRATNLPGPDGLLGTADDIHEHTNTTSPFVDQNQTYSSHPSHQVFLRAYQMNAGQPVSTGKLIVNTNLGADGRFGGTGANADTVLGGMATWAVVKAQARDLLGINLTDADFDNVPLLATDPYGKFIRGAHGLPQVVMRTAGPDGIIGTADDGTTLVEGNLAAPISLANAVRTGHAFLNDIARSAVPVGDHDGNPATPPQLLTPDADTVAGGPPPALGFYDNELLNAHFIAGDGRVNENIGLTTVHHIFHSEHNRQVDEQKATLLASGDLDLLNGFLLTPVAAIPANPSSLVWDGERLFQAAKVATEMQYQHLVFEEFARKVQPNVDPFLAPDGFDATIDASIVAEFAHTVYRFGHSMLLETIDRLDPNFQSSEIGLIAAFLNPLEFNPGGLTAEQAAGAIVRGVTRQVGNEIDEFVTEALRNNLLGLPLDLPTINMARARDTGIPSLNMARTQFFDMTQDSQLAPYVSWADYAEHLKHEVSIINFIAAYGTHPTVTAATTLVDKRAAAINLVLGGPGEPADRFDFLHGTGTWAGMETGLNLVDFWIGGLAEEKMPFGGMLGSSFNFVFETQMEALQNGDRLYYLSRLSGTNFLTELENNSFAKLVMANTNATHLPSDIFSTPGLILEADITKQYNANVFNNPGPDGIPGTPDDIATPREDPLGGSNFLTPLVMRDDPHTAGPDANYLKYTGVEHVVLGGTPGNDTLISSEGDDTLWGDAGNDRLEGGYGNDNIEGGDGDDIITDLGGDDVLKGNDGNDVIQAGNSTIAGFNLVLGGRGSDFIITTEDISEIFAGEGNDFILGAKVNGQEMGGEGNDWIEGGTQDGAPGDNFDPFETDQIIGNDVFVGGGGFDEFIGEGGDDIFVGSDGQDKMGGMSGYDWATYKNERFGISADMNILAFFNLDHAVAPSGSTILDAFEEVEGLSGSTHNDILRGSDVDATTIINHGGFTGSALLNPGLINGLQAFLGAGVTQFVGGNIIFGGDGSDIIEGRGGDDLIDGDMWLNVRISVRDAANHAVEIDSADSMVDLIPAMLSGKYNPGQLEIVREILTAPAGYDTAVYSDIRANYTISTTPDGTTTVTHNVPDGDGSDRLTNIERLQFADQRVVLVAAGNAQPAGLLAIVDDATGTPDNTPTVGQTLRATLGNVTDADGIGPISYVWQFEPLAGTGVFVDVGAANEEVLAGATFAGGSRFTVTADLAGLAIRVRAIYNDGHDVMENVFSATTAPVAPGAPAPAPAPFTSPPEVLVASPGVHYIRSDLNFILDQIKLAEHHAAGENLVELLPNIRMPLGLRTVSGEFNNLVQDQTEFGAADTVFPRATTPNFRDGQPVSVDLDGPGPMTVGTPTSYTQTSGFVFDSQPRTISNLIVDQTANNPAAVVAASENPGSEVVISPGLDGLFGTADDKEVFFIPNVAADAGLSAPFNAWMTFFGQFFDHGLDLVTKGGSGTVFIPLQPDDPLFVPGGSTNFLVLDRATNRPGPDGILGTADDIHEHENTTSPFVDQNQTYTSHPSHQVFLRAYTLDATGAHSTGKLIVNTNLGADGRFGTADDSSIGGMATWAVVKAQARDVLGINLTDADFNNVPLLATDDYGNFIRGAQRGLPQVVTRTAGADGILGTADDGTTLVEGNTAAPISLANAVRTGHAFLNDIAHNAVPGTVFDTDGNPATPGLSVVQADADNIAGNPIATDFAGRKVAYDDELLNAHYIAGDGRVNENIGLTTVHHVFHAEHNRLVDHTKAVVLATNDVAFLNEWLLTPVTAVPADPSTLVWNGERLFQAAKFGTEMQYQHLVFEEFARTVQPMIDPFFAPTQVYDLNINPAIVAEFAHTVYRFGHSMLLETVDRFDPDFNVVGNDPTQPDQQIGLIAAFLNPLAFAASGPTAEEAAGAIVRGLTRQVGNEIDEFVTEALRNNLLGLPLDLATINLARGRDAGIPSLNAARREFYNATGDENIKPYNSWADFVQHIKHPESLINFIAAYGTHWTILDATTLEGKRAAAMALVFGGPGAPTDRLDFLNGTGQWANRVDGSTTTGLDNVDLWIGGLAEEKMPFGGMLGSTFMFVFENQLEKLQDGDRFYYLERTAGLNFNTELENNSFAKLIMANTDATHLPALVFSTPGLILETDITRQFNASVFNDPGPDGIPGTADDIATPREDPAGGTILTPLVIRDDPHTAAIETNYLKYTGVEHVVLGGTPGNDTLISSEGDDTVWGDAGNDRIEGGFGNDQLRGGDGDDIITDTGGDDNIQGGDGNDAIHGGNGLNLILGGFGNDFIVDGEDFNEVFGGPGDDFIRGTPADEQLMGNEGDDWIEFGTSDGAPGDNFDPLGNDPIVGNDIYIGSSGPDKFNAEGGDDIMLGNGGSPDLFLGASGFDWASMKMYSSGVEVDMSLTVFDQAQVSLAGLTNARFTFVEGVSGSPFGDILRGDDRDAAAIAISGAHGSVMTNIALINGMQQFLDSMLAAPAGTHVTSFGAGNIMLGGDGSDVFESRGGSDLIDGDAWLNTRISVRSLLDPNVEIDSADTMTDLIQEIFSGQYSVGQLKAVREILMADGSDDVDTVFYNGHSGIDFDILPDQGDGLVRIAAPGLDGVLGTADDEIDVLRNIERIQFSDEAVIDLTQTNDLPSGLLVISDNTPTEDQLLTVSAADVFDPDNVSPGNPLGRVDLGDIAYFWQSEARPGDGVFEDILSDGNVFAAGGSVHFTGTSFTPGDGESGLRLRVRAVYQDANGVLEEVFSEPTEAVQNINDAPVGQVTISDTTPTQGEALTATNFINDDDGIANAVFTYTWQRSQGAGFITVGTGASYTPGAADVNARLRVVATYTDDQGTTETVISAPTDVVGVQINAGAGAQTITGTAGEDLIHGGDGADNIDGVGGGDRLFGDAGGDTLTGGAGADLLDGGADNDTLNGGAGDDTLLGRGENDTLNGQGGNDSLDGGAGNDIMDGGDGDDTLAGGGDNDNMQGGTGNDLLSGEGGTDTLNGGDGNDTLLGGAGADTLNGNAGNDLLDGGGGADAMNGGAGDDTYVQEGNDIITEALGGGIDTVLTAENHTLAANVDNLVFTGTGNFSGTGNAINNVIAGGDGNDTLSGAAGNDTLVGGLGADTLDGGAGNDTMLGGGGNDTYVVDSALDTVFEFGDDGVDTVRTALATYTAPVHVENIVFTGAGAFNATGNVFGNTITGGAGNDTLTGLESRDVLNGGAGNDTLNGGQGDDTLLGGAGDDILNGGAGFDILDGGAGNDTYVNAEDGEIVEGAGGGTDSIQTSANTFTLGANFENLTFIGVGNFTGTGNALANVITGGAGNDTLSGLAGNDTLNGGLGNDTLDGGAGTDTMVGGAGDDTYLVDVTGDTVIEAANAGTDSVLATTASYILGANVENLTFVGVGNFTGTGNALANIITGGGGNDTLNGADGNDTLNGGTGTDTMAGGAGDDTYLVDVTGDVINEANNAGTDSVLATAASYTLSTGVENLTFVGVGNFSGTGNAANNVITGGTGNDSLSGGNGDDSLVGGAGVDNLTGGAGADRLTGGAGNDTMDGGAGDDIFMFATGFGADTINGFDAVANGGQDLLNVSGLGITAANFNAHVTIQDLGANTLVTIDLVNSILLNGVDGNGTNAITVQDFLFTP